MLKVRGESMIEAGIMDGDLILVQQTVDVHNGEIVVAMIDGFESEATPLRLSTRRLIISDCSLKTTR